MILRPDDPRRSFPAARGIQAGKEAYVCWLKYAEIVQVFKLDYLELPFEERSQRTPKPKHAQEIADYVVADFEDHIIPPLIASINGEVEFEVPNKEFFRCGMLHIAIDALLTLIDGQHRRLSCEKLLKIAKEIGLLELHNEMIPVYFIIDAGLRRNQKAFAAINANVRNLEGSLQVLYKDTPSNNFTLEVVKEVEFLKNWTEFEKGTVPKTSPKLLTLKWVYKVHEAIRPGKSHEEDKAFCIAFWNALVANIPQWNELVEKKIEPRMIRQDHVCGLAIFLDAIASVGKMISSTKKPEELMKFFGPLNSIDWSKSNADWQGRILDEEKVITDSENIKRFAIYLKFKLGVPVKAFSKEEVELENACSDLLKAKRNKG
jgi:DNA sulfur modification protein DndB